MVWVKTYTDGEAQRVNRWLAQSGVCSRREAEDLIAQGLVSIDGETVRDPGRKISPGQTLTLADKADTLLSTQRTIVLHKPIGFVSSQPERGQTPAARLITPANLAGPAAETPSAAARLAPLGRLDLDSRGLLILSEDGVLAKAVIGPASSVDKEYIVTVEGDVTPPKIALLRQGLSLDGRVLKRAQVERIGPRRLRFVLREGRNRQIRRMCEAVGLLVVDLVRVRIGPLLLGDLPEGRWRLLSDHERTALIGWR